MLINYTRAKFLLVAHIFQIMTTASDDVFLGQQNSSFFKKIFSSTPFQHGGAEHFHNNLKKKTTSLLLRCFTSNHRHQQSPGTGEIPWTDYVRLQRGQTPHKKALLHNSHNAVLSHWYTMLN